MGGEWLLENRGSQILLMRSRNIGIVCDKLRSLDLYVFLSLKFSNKGLGVSKSVGFYHSSNK